MSSRTANTAAKIPAASRGPRQSNAKLLPDLPSDMAKQLLLISLVRSDRLWRQGMRPIPNGINPPQAAPKFLGNFRSRFERCLRAPPPPADKLVEVFTVRAITANRQPFTLRQSRQQTEIGRAHCQSQFALLLQHGRQRKPFVLGTRSSYCAFAQIGKRSDG